MTVLAAALSALGALSELAGLGLVVLGIARDRDRARHVLVTKPRKPQRQRKYPGERMAPRPRSFPSSFRSDRDNMRALAEYAASIDAGAYNNFIRVQKAFHKELDDSVDLVRNEATVADNELRDHLKYLLAGSVRDRVIGAVFLGVGIVLSGAGSVIGSLAS